MNEVNAFYFCQKSALFCRELSVINVFERNTYSVVNVVDNALQVRTYLRGR